MYIVQVRHIQVQDKNAKRYTYKVPDNESLNKGDMVLTRNVNMVKRVLRFVLQIAKTFRLMPLI